MEAGQLSVVVAARHAVVAEVVRRSCEAVPGIEVVGEARDTAALIEACARLRPDVVVVDDRLDDAAPVLTQLAVAIGGDDRPAVVVLSDRADGVAVLEALRAGARGYVRKADGLPTVGSVVRRVAEGERVIDPDLEQAAVMALGRLARRARERSEVEASLTPRELEILVMVSRGLTMQQVGRRLGISPRTVETHVAKLYRKLGVRTRIQAVARAAELHLIEP